MATEKRLIDANEIEELFYEQVKRGATDLMDAFDDALQDAQTVDAVEVVRCGKCVHSVTDEENPGMCKCIESAEYESESGFWLGFTESHTPDFYCAYGERKDNG